MSTQPFIADFNRVLRGLSPRHLESLKLRELVCIRAIDASRRNCQRDAVAALEIYAKRQITDDAEWVYDDFLLFGFVCVMI